MEKNWIGWTDKEIELLKKIYATASWEELEKTFKRKRDAIRAKANSLELKKVCKDSWLPEERELLKNLYLANVPLEEVEKKISRHSRQAIEEQVKVLNLKRPKIESKPELTAPPVDQEALAEEKLKNLLGEDVKPRRHKLPKLTSAAEPYIIEAKNCRVLLLNSPMIGALPPESEETDIVKNSLRLAEAAKCDAVFLTGNVLYFLTQHWGTQLPAKLKVSGLSPDLKKLKEYYPKEVLEDPEFQSLEDRLAKGDPIFMPVKARLDHVLDMVRKEFLDKDGKPLFSGKILIGFGKVEEALGIFYTTEKIRLATFKEKAIAQKRINKLVNEWRMAKRQKNNELVAQLQKKIDDWQEYLTYVIMTNNSPQYVKKVSEEITAYIVHQYEDCIPNSKVIGLGDTFVKIGDKLAMFTSDKSGTLVQKELAGNLREKTYSYIKGHNAENIPDCIFGIGLNPHYTGLFVSYKNSAEKENLGDKSMCYVVQLPVCIYSERYRNVIRDQIASKDILTQLASQSDFESGVVIFEWLDDFDTPNIYRYKSDYLTNPEHFKDKKNLLMSVNGEKPESKIIFVYTEGCTHYGARQITYIKSLADKTGRLVKYFYQVAMEMLIRISAPILMCQHDGDVTQGTNVDYSKEIHPEWKKPEEMILAMEKIEKDQKLSSSEKSLKTRFLAIMNSIFEGVLDYKTQIKGYVQSVLPYKDFYIGILKRAKKVGLTVNGRLSVITIGRGNHSQNSFPKDSRVDISDAEFIVELLQKELLKSNPELAEEIEKGILAPSFERLGEARGNFGIASSKYRYGFYMKHKQGGSKSKDNMRPPRMGLKFRGTNDDESGLFMINKSGDDHFGGDSLTRSGFHIKTGGQMNESGYGRQIDFPPQNVFSTIYGVPVGGPAHGPLVTIFLDFTTLRKWANKPFEIDRSRLFKNALE